MTVKLRTLDGNGFESEWLHDSGYNLIELWVMSIWQPWLWIFMGVAV